MRDLNIYASVIATLYREALDIHTLEWDWFIYRKPSDWESKHIYAIILFRGGITV